MIYLLRLDKLVKCCRKVFTLKRLRFDVLASFRQTCFSENIIMVYFETLIHRSGIYDVICCISVSYWFRFIVS